jgi:hypothetical protein
MILVFLKNKPFSILLINDVFVLPKKSPNNAAFKDNGFIP